MSTPVQGLSDREARPATQPNHGTVEPEGENGEKPELDLCETCGGSKEVLVWAVSYPGTMHPPSERWEPCPDCRETTEEQGTEDDRA